ncbi:MAG: hypothetical protein JSR87_07580 [Proteobacteria bacterium]|nr:hypothetical protein [Pseudomonadota bacterium]MBS0572667.1 hypothetical protein [Pseudomonadota bacterium]
MQTAGLFLILALIALCGLCAVVFTLSLGFRRRVARLWTRAAQGPSAEDQGDRLPPAVRAFALRAGAEAGPGHLALVLTQAAELRRRRGGLFAPFRARQITALGEPGFVWQARRGFGPLTLLRVVDSFTAGEGRLEARLFGALTVARMNGVETTLGEAFRYLAELPWTPDAILGNPDLVWKMTADDEAEVKLNTRVGTARVVFRFDGHGDIVAMEARDRPASDPEGRPVRYDWRGRFGDYRQIGARRLPAYGEVGYVYPDGYEVYFRARVTDCRTAPGQGGGRG